jgi:hypothetical protein
VIRIAVSSAKSQLREARHTIRDRLSEDHEMPRAHIEALEAVASELLGAAFETGFRDALMLSIEPFALLTSVRVHCTSDVELRDEPFGLRERVLHGHAFAWGKRAYVDGSVDLWAEVARPGVDQHAVRASGVADLGVG